MKKYFFILFLLISFGCVNQGGNPASSSAEPDHEMSAEEKALPSTGNFGEVITATDAMQVGDFLQFMSDKEQAEVKVTGTVRESCQHSGCWMDLDLGNGEVMNIAFRDGKFLIPKDAAGKTAVIAGTATKKMLTVDRLKAYAADEGKSQEEIDAITEPKWEYSFIADGVILQ